MLDLSNQETIVVPAWDSIALQAELPCSTKEFFEKSGAMPIMPDSRRQYNRTYGRKQVVIEYKGEFLAGYLTDISRSGLGVISPVQMFPFDQLQGWLSENSSTKLRVKRCRREGERCYVVGCVFEA